MIHLKNGTKRRTVSLILVMAMIVALLPVMAGCTSDPNPEETEGGTAAQQTELWTEPMTTADTQPTESLLPTLEYPLILEDGKLEIENLFQYEGINPDCDLEDGRNVASVMLKNTSDAYLEEAKITLTLVDGTVLHFTVMDLPAGKTVMAFETANIAAEENALCAHTVCTASWASETVALPEDIDLTVDGVAVTVTNNTGHDISELVISCRCPLGEEYFGGIAYQYTINDLPANESATVEAWDCILGIAEVVRVAVNQE